RQSPEVKQNCFGRNPRDKYTKKFPKSHRHRGHGAGLNHQEERPAVKETKERAKGFTQVDILPASLRYHARQFTITDGRDDGHQSTDEPSEKEQARRLNLATNISGYNKNARPNHRAHDQGGGIKKTEALEQPRRLRIGDRRRS